MREELIETVIHADDIRRVVIRNAAGEPVSSIHVPEGGALVMDVLGYTLEDPVAASKGAVRT